MKPKIGKVIYVLYLAGWHKEIHREKVFMYGTEGFICESIVDASLDDNYRIREYNYNDYNKTWFTSLAEAKLSLKEMLEERNPNFIIKINRFEDYWKAYFERRAE